MTTKDFKIKVNYENGAGHFIYIYDVTGRVKGKRIHYESIRRYTSKEKAEQCRILIENIDKNLTKSKYDYITIKKEIVWID